ncbi:GIN domain-containing protein [Brevundimonas sp.]|uniref:GIN domain-containing protein n=1 Tax=Brevundimonas sp. TaxID=1871086 RepID=UPI002FC7C371
MKLAIVSATAIAAALAAVAAGPAAAMDGPSAKIKHAVARVVVIVEDRSDIGVEIEQGTSGLPAVQVSRRGDDVIINGGLRGGLFGNSGIRNCRSGPEGARQPGEGSSVEVRNVGRVNLADAPLVVIRTPRDVEVNVESGAVFGAVGRGASSIELGNGGCGDWTVANTNGEMSLSIMGSGDMRAGTSGRLEANIMGSGNIGAGATGGLEANIMGSGDINAARVDGPLEANIMGSGDINAARVDGSVEANIMGSGTITVGAGNVSTVEASIPGSGEINIPGTVTSLEASIMGSGDINVGGVTGAVSHSVMGSGHVRVAGQALPRNRHGR